MSGVIDEVQEWYDSIPEPAIATTHSGECWKRHTPCMARIFLKEIERMENEQPAK